MDLVAVEPPTLRVPLSGEATELRYIFFGGGLRGETLQAMPDELIQAHPHALSYLLGSFGKLLIDGDSQSHWWPSCLQNTTAVVSPAHLPGAPYLRGRLKDPVDGRIWFYGMVAEN